MSSATFSGLRKIVAAPDIAIDLGTANTRIYARGQGLIADEPSLIKLKSDSADVEAVGTQAARLAAIDPQAHYLSPLHGGVVTDVAAAGLLLAPFLRRARRFGLRPRALACVPTDACEEERDALMEATCRAGVSSVVTVRNALAAAIGAGLDVSSPYAQMIVDIGDGVTETAVIRGGEIMVSAALRVACSDLHRAVGQAVAGRYGVLLFPPEAERLTHEVGTANDSDRERLFLTAGADLLAGRSVSLCVSSYDILFAVEPVLQTILNAVGKAVRELPLDLACEVIESGICLTGGGACLPGLPERLEAGTGIGVRVAGDPLHATINGAKEMLTVGAATELWTQSTTRH